MAQSLTGYCGCCAGEEDVFINKMLVCESCGVKAHDKCTDGYGFVLDDGAWQCAVCSNKGDGATVCCLCLIKSSQLLRRPTYSNSIAWVHSVCLHSNYVFVPGEEDAGEVRKDNSDEDDSQNSDNTNWSDDDDDDDEDKDDDNDDDEDDDENNTVGDNNDDYTKCRICGDDDPTDALIKGRNKQQKVLCYTDGCEMVFHMSCAWLKGYKMEKVNCTIVNEDDESNLMIPIKYKVNAYCADHSESQSLISRGKVDDTARDLVVTQKYERDAYERKASSSSSRQSSSSKVKNEKKNDGHESGDSFDDYYCKSYASYLKKERVNEEINSPLYQIGVRKKRGSHRRSGKEEGRLGESMNRNANFPLLTKKISTNTTSSTTIMNSNKIKLVSNAPKSLKAFSDLKNPPTTAPSSATTLNSNKNKSISNAPRILKSSSDLKNSNAQEDYRIARQKRIAEEMRNTEAAREGLFPTKDEEKLSTITALSSNLLNTDTTAYISATSSPIDANQLQIRKSYKMKPICVASQP